MSKRNFKPNGEKCSMEEIMRVIGGKWTMPIIYTLSSGTKRFKELERGLPTISTRMLVKELKNLEQYKVVKREAFATVPPTVEYSLTESGRALEPIIFSLYKWGQEQISVR
ncbi:MAG: helix-turn-helix transcriptional regulator [Bacteroidetes bacterium]|nr:helix-turn-helix transcriptional regulator [Bacteroidota bacterium]